MSALRTVLDVEAIDDFETLADLGFDASDLLDLCHRTGTDLSRYTNGGNLTERGKDFLGFVAFYAKDGAKKLDAVKRDPFGMIMGLTADEAYKLYRVERAYSKIEGLE